jgi:3-dehydroquinate dehydratase
LLCDIEQWANELGCEVECFQSNHEGTIVDKIQQAYKVFDGIVINPAAYTHTSIAILDALKAVGAKDTSKTYRTKVANANGIAGYRATSSQNLTMLNLLKQGKLIYV